MSKEQKIKAIREKCIETNPEIVELKFGCEVMPKYPTKRVKWAKILAHFGGENYRVMERLDTSVTLKEYENDYGYCVFTAYRKDSFESIGRPIRLADVLLAISRKENREELPNGESAIWSIMTSGHFVRLRHLGTNGEEVHSSDIVWNLKKDSLEEQNEKCIDFIWKVSCSRE